MQTRTPQMLRERPRGHRGGRWAFARQAYTPRVWPGLVIAGLGAVLVSLLLSATGHTPSTLGAGAIGCVLGWLAGKVQWWFWSWRHPLLSYEELDEIIRRTAPWN